MNVALKLFDGMHIQKSCEPDWASSTAGKAGAQGNDLRLESGRDLDLCNYANKFGTAESTRGRTKKIVFILPKVSYEGVAKVGLLQANLLTSNYNFNAEVISLIKEKQKFKELLSNLKIRYALPIGVLTRCFYHASTLFSRIESDFILAHNIPATIVSNRIYKRNGIPYAAYIHDATFKHIPGSLPSFGYSKIKESLDNSTAIFTNSLKTLHELGREYNVKGMVLHPGCFPTGRISNGSSFFLLVHFIRQRDSFSFLVKLIEKNDFNLIIAGGRRWGWRKVVHSFHKFGNRVRFVFEPTEAQLSNLYQHAKGLIFPEVENFGLSPLEAAACGCPSIVADRSGVLEVLEKGKEIIACKEGDVEGFSEAIQMLKNDKKRAEEIGEKAWMKAKECSWDIHISRLARIISNSS